jgi:pimeloyl-ACP methyl ester carboxylesterase
VPAMSNPPFLDPPPGTHRASIATARGSFAALDLAAEGAERGLALLVPGFTGSKEDFIAVLQPLAAAGWRVVAYDQRGQYESAQHGTGHADPAEAYAIGALGQDVLAVVDALGGRPHLVGHSFGGLVARAAVLSAPARFASLTLMSSGPGAMPGAQQRQTLRQLEQALPVHGIEAVWRAKCELDRATGWWPPENPETAEFLERRFLANSPTALAAKAEQLRTAPDEVDALARVLAAPEGPPAQVVFGEHDDGWPVGDQERMAERLGVPAVCIPGAVHSPAAERPAETAAVLDAFWRSADR